jgi:hypothetical protein
MEDMDRRSMLGLGVVASTLLFPATAKAQALSSGQGTRARRAAGGTR